MNIFEETKKVSDTHPEKDLLVRLAKLQEEAGELSAATLKLIHYKPRNGMSEAELIANQYEEAVDILLVAYDIIHKLGVSEAMIEAFLYVKLQKWRNSIENQKKENA